MTTTDGKVNWKIYAERPGLFHLPLNASKNPPVKQISHRIKVTEKLIRLFPSGFTNIASRNLLGVLCFYNGDFARAVKTFQEILQYQNDSLTALANLAFVYKRLKQNSKATNYLELLTKEIEENTPQTKSTAMADQAFAFLFDCYMETDLIERNKLPKELFVQSLLLLENNEFSMTVVEMKYWLGQTYFRLFSQCHTRKDMGDMEKEFYFQGIKELAGVIEMTEKTELSVNKEIVSVTWAFIGTFLGRRGKVRDENGVFKLKTIQQMDDDIKDHLKQLNLFQFLENPEECFQKGLALATKSKSEDNNEPHSSTELLIRYALYLKSNDKFEEALEKLNEALEVDNTQENWFALTVRAGVLEMLNRIDDSITDRELACSWNPSPTDLYRLAKAYHGKYMSCEEKNSEIAEDYLLKASDCFSRTVQLLGQVKRPEIYCAHGRFLRDIGETKEAIESFKRAMEIDSANKKTIGFSYLFETLLQYYRHCVDSNDKRQAEKDKILHEMAYFYEAALRRHDNLTRETEKFLSDYEKEMAMLTAYFKQNRPNSHIRGTNISDIITSISNERSDDKEKWNEIVEENVCCLKAVVKSQSEETERNTNVLCANCKCTVLTRQLSVFPDPREKPRSLIYDYDFYVIFSAMDRDWVCHMLLETLENSYGYKGMIPERDIMPGTTDLYKRVDMIHSCSKILVILSQDFEGNPECEYELSHALKRKQEENSENLLIPIVRKVDGIHRSLRTITVLDAVDDCDWNKLINAIEST